MQKRKSTKSARVNNRFIDILIVVFFLSVAVLSVNLFMYDFYQTYERLNEEHVGVVVARTNTVQRRPSDRVLWDRLSNASKIYIGDLIRVADVSSVTLDIDNNSISLNENTLIRVTRAPDGESIQINLSGGNVSLTTGEESSGIILNLGGRTLQAGPGTVLNASTGDSGVSVHVSEGTAQLAVIERNEIREITFGNAIAIDAAGAEVEIKTIVVLNPAVNAHYLKNTQAPLSVNFLWNRINLQSADALRLEIALDSGFTQIFRIINGLDSQVQVFFDTGLWHWRLSLDNTVLGEGRLTVLDGAGPQLLSPAASSVFRYTDDPPVVNFQWAHIEEASFYVLEISDDPVFENPQVNRQRSSVFYSDSTLDQGTWYWRVKPEFPSFYNGTPVFSNAAFFRIEQLEPSVIEDTEETSLAEWLVREVPPELMPAPVLPELSLISPVQGANILGLTALRQQTLFSWNCDEEVESLRFVLSRNTNPFQGQAFAVIQNPSRTIGINRLDEGTWYWNVEVQTAEGFIISAAEHGQFRVQPISVLPAPQYIQPAAERRFNMNELRTLRNITFSWQGVQGANAYTFILYQQTEGGRREIVRSTESRTSYTLSDLRQLDRGTFVWQVEAVNRRGSVIEQRGTITERIFILDFPVPTPVQIDDAGILYGLD